LGESSGSPCGSDPCTWTHARMSYAQYTYDRSFFVNWELVWPVNILIDLFVLGALLAPPHRKGCNGHCNERVGQRRSIRALIAQPPCRPCHSGLVTTNPSRAYKTGEQKGRWQPLSCEWKRGSPRSRSKSSSRPFEETMRTIVDQRQPTSDQVTKHLLRASVESTRIE